MSPIAFIGLGHMGGPMAANLVKAGHNVRGFDLTAASLELARENGISTVASVAEAVSGCRHRDHHAAGGASMCWASGRSWLPCRALGHAAHRLLDHRRRERPQGPCARAETHGCPRSMHRFPAAPAALQGATLTFMVGGSDGLPAAKAGARGDGQEDRPLRRRRRRPGGEDLQQHDPRHFSMIGVGEAFVLGREARPVAPGAVRRRLRPRRANAGH
jgi:3-hydroxyisobutyrate dehydrogenase